MANLQLARAQTTDRLEVEDGGALVSFVRRVLVEWTTLDLILRHTIFRTLP